jgi:hypothetical protein
MPDSSKPVEVFAVETHRFDIDADADLLVQIISLGRQIMEMERSHADGARVRAIVVEMERPVT